jgi:hypothetical protein
MGTGWSKPKWLPDTVNLDGQSLWKPSIATAGTIYFVAIDAKGGKRLFSSHYLMTPTSRHNPFHSAMALHCGLNCLWRGRFNREHRE